MPNNRLPSIVPERPERPERRARLQPKPLPRSPLALAIMSLLYERPMHPYEMQTNMRERGHHNVIKVKGGSLYDTVERLERLGFIATLETSREGRRPERTVYTITESGRDELNFWLREMISEPAREYPEFAAALAFILVLDPDEAMQALHQRIFLLESRIAADEAMVKSSLKANLPRMVLIEGEYGIALQKAELSWTRKLIGELEKGSLRWPTAEDFMAAGYQPDTQMLERLKHGKGGEARVEPTTD
jgi:DNA-binding PadR family transcriptional regulator